MSDTVHRGTVSFVNHEKHFATIEYDLNGKKKSVWYKTIAPAADAPKPQQVRVGDEVHFSLKLTDRGDRLTATDVKVLYNPALERLVQKAKHENRFEGFIKKVEDAWFIKESESYLFIPLQLSPWQTQPSEQSLNTPVSFRLVNLEKPKSIAAELYFPVFVPEFKQAEKVFATKKETQAVVTNVSAHAVYALLFDKLPVKLPLEGLETLKQGDEVPVVITHLTPQRIVVKRAGNTPK